MLSATPGLADVFSFSSWGQTNLAVNEWDVFELQSTTSTQSWNTLRATVLGVRRQQAYQTRYLQFNPNYVMIIQPGTTFQATGYIGPLTQPGMAWTRQRGNSIVWQTMYAAQSLSNAMIRAVSPAKARGIVEILWCSTVLRVCHASRQGSRAGPQSRTLPCGRHDSERELSAVPGRRPDGLPAQLPHWRFQRRRALEARMDPIE